MNEISLIPPVEDRGRANPVVMLIGALSGLLGLLAAILPWAKVEYEYDEEVWYLRFWDTTEPRLSFMLTLAVMVLMGLALVGVARAATATAVAVAAFFTAGVSAQFLFDVLGEVGEVKAAAGAYLGVASGIMAVVFAGALARSLRREATGITNRRVQGPAATDRSGLTIEGTQPEQAEAPLSIGGPVPT